VYIVQDGVMPAGLVVDYSTAGMKELDELAAEIDSLRRCAVHVMGYFMLLRRYSLYILVLSAVIHQVV